MAVHELKDVQMTRSGESVDFVHGYLVESELEGKKLFDMTLKNVAQYEMFRTSQMDEERVQVTFTTLNDETGKAEMEVRTVNRRDPDDNIVELVTMDNIEFH